MSTRYTDGAIIVIRAVDLAAANNLAAQIDLEGGGQTFSVPLIRTTDPDNAAPFAYIACWAAMVPADAVAFRNLLQIHPQIKNRLTLRPFAGTNITAELAAANLRRVPAVGPV